ncbi:MAG: hypothetical protein C0601_03230 [Candidatus Muiribacterium halophilum]|uniref:LysM domain-containing protein n=1 Tax=Muiribacterium halophilum TaxID=2053465 RepID=A0A2N5ZK32_MUIH1|nr:MAG: hypothetical protein C0601_03230 [Candidatus Muirbacterium halophilum]
MDKKLLIAIVVIIGVILLFSVMKGDKGKDIVVEDNAGQVVVKDEPVIVEEDDDVSMEEETPFIEPEIEEEPQSEVNVERVPFNKDAEKDVQKQEVFEDDFYYVVRPGDTLWSLSL